MFSASQLAFLPASRYRLLCILPAVSLLFVGLALIVTSVQWQRIKVDSEIQRQTELNQSLRQELQQTARTRLGQLPMLRSIIAIDGDDKKISYGGELLAGLRDLAIESGLELKAIAEAGEPVAGGSLLRIELIGEPGQLAAYVQKLSMHITSLQGFKLRISRSPELNNKQEITLLLPPEILRLTQTGQAESASGVSQLGKLSVDGERWLMVRDRDGKLRLQKKGRL